MLCTLYIYTLQACMSTIGIVIHYIGYVVVSPQTPRKYTVLNGNFMFDLGDIFQEHNWGKNKTCLYNDN
jgi:hypothetical protein